MWRYVKQCVKFYFIFRIFFIQYICLGVWAPYSRTECFIILFCIIYINGDLKVHMPRCRDCFVLVKARTFPHGRLEERPYPMTTVKDF